MGKMIVHEKISLPVRAFLDANVLINAAFVRGCRSEQAVSQSQLKGHVICVDEATWLEAVNVVGKARVSLQLNYDPAGALEQFGKKFRILSLPPSIGSTTVGINRPDRSLVKAVKNYGGWLLTDDHPLIMELQGSGLFGITTSRAISILGMGPPAAPLYPAGRTKPSTLECLRRHNFLRVRPGAWCSTKIAQRFVAVDSEGRVTLYYDGSTHKWVAQPDRGPELSFKMEMIPGQLYTVCFSYEIYFTSWKRGKLRFMVGSASGEIKSDSKTILGASFLSMGTGNDCIGSARDNTSHWNGHVPAYSNDVGFVGPDVFKAVLAAADISPSVSTADILPIAMPLVAQDHNGIFLTPSEGDLYA
jgi:hypothetical protein